ncbi:adrenodoxin-like [Diadema antillarum]|uniref:adrenodoxin-like n=2 Tax=Diadema antillarum TaxID=105358 RepID=UPI003A850965
MLPLRSFYRIAGRPNIHDRLPPCICQDLIPRAAQLKQPISFSRISEDRRRLHTQICSSGTGMKLLIRDTTKNATYPTASRTGHSFMPLPIDFQSRVFSSTQLRTKKEEITVHFMKQDGERLSVKAKVGETLLDTVIDNDVDIDGFGACEGTLACSTCHLVFPEEIYEQLPEKLDEEEDMLDLAYGLEDTSRLGCQITLTKEMDNMEVVVPEGVSDARDV